MTTERSWDELIAQNEQEYAESWVPNKNDEHPRTLVGTALGYSIGPPTKYEEEPAIFGLRERDGKDWGVWLLSEQLKDEFRKQLPDVGERVVLRYIGMVEKKSAPGEFFHKYVLTVDREQELPAALKRPELEPGQERRRDLQVDPNVSDVPGDEGDEFRYGQQRPPGTVDIPDADVVDETNKDKADDDIPF